MAHPTPETASAARGPVPGAAWLTIAALTLAAATTALAVRSFTTRPRAVDCDADAKATTTLPPP